MTPYQLGQSYTSLYRAVSLHPTVNWADAMSIGQMQSKAWAIDELAKTKKKLGMVYIVAGWLGTMAMLLLSEPKLKIDKIRSFDLDPTCQQPADQLNIEHLIKEWTFKAVTKNLFEIDYATHEYKIPVPGGYTDPKTKKFVANKPALMVESPDTIINTSCDHIKDFSTWWNMIPRGKLTVLQNNNFIDGGDDHVNIVTSLQKFADMAPMSKVLFSGEREFAKYTRYMLIGTR